MKTVQTIEEQITFEQMRERAGLLVKSGLLPTAIKTAEQALAIALMGREYGIPMMKAFQSINIISGKPCLSAQLLLALCHNTGELESYKLDSQPSYCRITMKRKGREPYVYLFGDVQASVMMSREYDQTTNTSKVCKLIEKYNYRTMKAIMYEWRAVTHACRIVFPDAVLGLYSTDEIEDIITESQEAAIERKSEIAEAAIEKREEIEAPKTMDPNNIHHAAEEAEFIQKISGGFIQDTEFYKLYADRTIGEIFADKTPGGVPKGKQYLQKVAAGSSHPEERASLTRFLELMEKPQ